MSDAATFFTLQVEQLAQRNFIGSRNIIALLRGFLGVRYRYRRRRRSRGKSEPGRQKQRGEHVFSRSRQDMNMKGKIYPVIDDYQDEIIVMVAETIRISRLSQQPAANHHNSNWVTKIDRKSSV